MADRIWLGDFRCKALQRLSSMQQNNEYIFDDFASYSWFATNGLYKLESSSLSNTDVIIMLGLVDCINSCIWDTFKIDQIIASYISVLNTLVEKYPSCRFYFCAVNPVKGSYSSSFTKNEIITEKTLNTKIKSFNKAIKTCKATYIDSYDYLLKTGFSTYDSVHYTQKTSSALYDYILSNLAGVFDNSFKPRMTAPLGNQDSEFTDPMDNFWIHTSHSGNNPFPLVNGSNGSTLPNSTAYAWGRFYEILGSEPKLSTDKVEKWFDYTGDGYNRGQEPALGAVMCWKGTTSANTDGKGGRGHVAIVEKINSDGSVITSESAWNNSTYWWTTTREKGTDGRWGETAAYTFQGFIYNPVINPTPEAIAVDKSQVTTHTGSTTQEERETNAKYIYKYLASRGWTLNAVAGLLGNLEHESWINPGVTEINGNGFGLVQWTPPSKFTRWCDAQDPPLPHDDVDSQLARIEHERDPNNPDNGVCAENDCAHSQYSYRTIDSYGDKYAMTFTPKTFKEFATSTKSPYDLACAFLYNYECPGSICWGAGSYAEGKAKTIKQREERRAVTRETRGKAAEKWYKFLAPYSVCSAERFIATGLKIDNITPISVTVSFIVRGGIGDHAGSYTITDESGKSVDSGKLDDILKLEKANFKVISFSNKPQTLVPNTKYTLTLSIASHAGEGNTAEYDIDFSTPQDYPESVKNIKLSANDLKLPHDSFNLEVDSTGLNWGYWKSNGYGYTLQLMVNGTIKTEKELISIPETFELSDYFNYKAKVGDTIQIGIRTWVMYNGKKLFDSDFAKCSNPVCMLAKPITAYIKNN